MKTFHILSIFPELLGSYFKESLMRRAIRNKIIRIATYDLRDFSESRYQKVDDRPFGGGPGMVLQVAPIARALARITARKPSPKTRTILLSPRGKEFSGRDAERLANYDHLVFICGRYEGVDERVADKLADEVVSIGNYVLSGGELAAVVVLEAVARFIPGFLGRAESLEAMRGSYPAYTRPEAFHPRKGVSWKVPEVLLSGDHQAIQKWRRARAKSER